MPLKTSHMRVRNLLSKPIFLFTFIAVLIYSGNELWQVIAWPPFYSLDEVLDIDYIYRITQGQLPEFYDGVSYNPLGLDYSGAVQWKYQHPPLFYILEAPIMMLFEQLGRPIAGIWAMRFFVYLLGILTVSFSGWAAYWIFGKRNNASLIVPLLVASNKCLQSVVFNYTLATLWIILLTGFTARIIRTHLSRKAIVIWWLLIALAPLIRTSLIPITFLCLVIVVLSVVFQGKNVAQRLLVLACIPVLVAFLDSAWFYVRLYRLSGNFTGSMPSWSTSHLGRRRRTFFEALTDLSFWKDSFSQYHNFSAEATQYLGWFFVIVLTFIPLTVGIAAFIVHCCRSRTGRASSFTHEALISLLLLGMLGGTSLQQVLYYRQGGSTNPVYFSMISIAFASFIAFGLTAAPQLSRWVIPAWLGMRLCALLLEMHNRWPASAPANGHAELGIYIAVAAVILGTAWASMLAGSRLTLESAVAVTTSNSAD